MSNVAHYPFLSPKATGKIFLTITRIRMYFLLCLLGSENSEFRVHCAVLTQSNVMETPKLGKSLKIFLLCFSYMNPQMDPLNKYSLTSNPVNLYQLTLIRSEMNAVKTHQVVIKAHRHKKL